MCQQNRVQLTKAEIVEDLGKLEIECGNESRLSHHAQHLGSEMGDALCELLDILHREQGEPELIPDSDEH
jgi:hypothetical protein